MSQLSKGTEEALRKAAARRNTSEAIAHLDKWVPKVEPAPPEPTETTAAGQCFRRVSAILAGRGK